MQKGNGTNHTGGSAVLELVPDFALELLNRTRGPSNGKSGLRVSFCSVSSLLTMKQLFFHVSYRCQKPVHFFHSTVLISLSPKALDLHGCFSSEKTLP